MRVCSAARDEPSCCERRPMASGGVYSGGVFFRKRKRKMTKSCVADGGHGVEVEAAAGARPKSIGQRKQCKRKPLMMNTRTSGELATNKICLTHSAVVGVAEIISIILVMVMIAISALPPCSALQQVKQPIELQTLDGPQHLTGASAFIGPQRQRRSVRTIDFLAKVAASDHAIGISSREVAKRSAHDNNVDQRTLPRSTTTASSTTRLVGVSGRWLELACPLASELQAANPQDSLAIVWSRNGSSLSRQLSPRHRISPQNGSLVIVDAQANLDEATYECSLIEKRQPTGSMQKAVHKFELTLIVAPRLAPFEFPTDAQVGMKLVLTCSALEGQQPVSFVWLKDNQIIQSQQQQQHHQAGAAKTTKEVASQALNQLHQQQLADKQALGSMTDTHASRGLQSEYLILANSGDPLDEEQQQQLPLPLLSDANIRFRQSDDYSILSIDKLELKHSGRYTCSAQNEAARTSHSAQLIINAPPTLTVEPSDADLVSGQSSVIDCAASGHPRPVITWSRARELSDHQWDYVPVYDNARYTNLPNGSLVIANVSHREQGYYLCSAKNGFGPEMTKLIKITVHEPARFGAKYKSVEARIEERANLVCEASGELPIAIEWLDRQGNVIQRNDKRFIIDNEPRDDSATGSTTSKRSAAQQQQHEADEDTSSAVAAANNGTVVSRLILTRSGRLDSGHYTCEARNRHGSDKMVTNLLVLDVPDKATDLKVTNVTSTTISLRWQMGFSGNAPVTSYLVQYQSDDPLDDLLMSSAGRAATTAATTASTTTSITTTSTTSKQLSFSKPQVAPAPDTLAQGDLQQQAADLAASSSFKAALDALAAAANLENADEVIDRTLVELTVEQSASHLVVKDLSPHCIYRLRLAAINKIGLGEFSEWLRVKTEEAPPSGLALKIQAAATGPNSVKVTWSPPDRRSWNGQLIGFQLGYRPIDSGFELNKTVEWVPPTFQSIILDVDSKQRRRQHQISQPSGGQVADTKKESGDVPATNSTANKVESSGQSVLRQHLRQLLALQQQELVAHLTNLQRSTTYLVWIQAINQRGFGPKSHAISVKTLDDVPPSAPAIRVQSMGPSSITVAWSLLSNFVSSANQYSLYYRRVPNQLQQSQHSATNGSFNQALFAHQPPPVAGEPVGLQEPGPFIERTLTSQQLIVGANMFVGSDQQQLDPTFSSSSASASFMHQQAQQYQQFVYTLNQLDCGSIYEIYMTTRNSVGKSEPSALLTTRTSGEPPLAPANRQSLFARIGTHDVALNLGAWSTGGCPITHIALRYKQVPGVVSVQPSNVAQQPVSNDNSSASHPSALPSAVTSSGISWPITTSVPSSILAAINNQQLSASTTPTTIRPHAHGQQAGASGGKHPTGSGEPTTVYTLKSLAPITCYELDIIAQNAAGQTTAQYEFVTASSNGTRAGYSRKEGVYRIDQRGNPIEQPPAMDGGPRSIEQQASFGGGGNGAGASGGSALVPLFVMLLCFICLIISSAFCYHHLVATWKRQRRSSGSDSSSGPCGSRSLHCGSIGGQHHLGIGSSPLSVMNKSTSLWRINNHNSNNHHGSELPDHSPVHAYCVRNELPYEQQQAATSGGQHTSKGLFTQSVSMKDFNSVASCQAHASTLNMKNYRNSVQQRIPNGEMNSTHHNNKAGTMRARLFSAMPAYGDVVAQSNYGHLGENGYGQPKGSGDSTGYGQVDFATASSGQVSGQPMYGQQQQQHCGYSTVVQTGPASLEGQQQETSWTTNNGTAYGPAANVQQCTRLATYAIPSTTTATYGTNGAPDGIVEHSAYGQIQQQRAPLDYGACTADAYGQTSIDACIQQLVNHHQYEQQQQQQQQYATLAHQKAANQDGREVNNKCLYGNESSYNFHQQQEQLTTPNGNLHSTNTKLSAQHISHQNGIAQSVIDSSCSSSGVDVGHQIDCASSTATSNNSNLSNNGYQLAPNINCDSIDPLVSNMASELYQQQQAAPATST